MTKPKLQVSFVALITPFQEDGTPDIEGFGRLIDFQAQNATSALLIMGSTGEVSLLSQEERHQIITETAKFKKYGLPLFFGCTGNKPVRPSAWFNTPRGRVRTAPWSPSRPTFMRR